MHSCVESTWNDSVGGYNVFKRVNKYVLKVNMLLIFNDKYDRFYMVYIVGLITLWWYYDMLCFFMYVEDEIKYLFKS